MIDKQIIDWLLDSDVSMQYQVNRDLLMIDRPDLKAKISKEGWGSKIYSFRKINGQWVLGFYQPKWTSTHYTLLDMKSLSFPNNSKEIQSTIHRILRENICSDGGISSLSSSTFAPAPKTD
jgi:hypothetical protein